MQFFREALDICNLVYYNFIKQKHKGDTVYEVIFTI